MKFKTDLHFIVYFRDLDTRCYNTKYFIKCFFLTLLSCKNRNLSFSIGIFSRKDVLLLIMNSTLYKWQISMQTRTHSRETTEPHGKTYIAYWQTKPTLQLLLVQVSHSHFLAEL